MTTIILLSVFSSLFFVCLGGLVHWVNAPKIEAEKTAREIEATKQQAERDQAREVIQDRRLSFWERLIAARQARREANKTKGVL